MHGEQPALDEVGLLRLAQPDRAVGLAHGEVELLVGEDQLQLDVGIEVEELLDALGQPAGAETDGRGDAQRAGRLVLVLGQLGLDALELDQHVMRGAEQHLALLGQHQAARVAVEQRHADILLERADLPRDRRLRQMQLLGGMGERASLRRGVKHAQLVPVQRHAVPSSRLAAGLFRRFAMHFQSRPGIFPLRAPPCSRARPRSPPGDRRRRSRRRRQRRRERRSWSNPAPSTDSRSASA